MGCEVLLLSTSTHTHTTKSDTKEERAKKIPLYIHIALFSRQEYVTLLPVSHFESSFVPHSTSHLDTFTNIYHLVPFTFTLTVRTMVLWRSQTGITMHIRHKNVQTRGVRCRNAQFCHHPALFTAQRKK